MTRLTNTGSDYSSSEKVTTAFVDESSSFLWVFEFEALTHAFKITLGTSIVGFAITLYAVINSLS